MFFRYIKIDGEFMRERGIAVSIILSIVTCGIYGIYWFICLTNEAEEASDDKSMASGGVAFLLTLITCGIYGLYWAYKMGKLLMVAKEKNNLRSEDNSVLFLILQLIGFGIINYALIQNSLNEIVRAKQGQNGSMSSSVGQTKN